MTPDEARQILAALDGIKVPYNGAIPHFKSAQGKFGTQLDDLVRQYNVVSKSIQESFDEIRAVCAIYAEVKPPVISQLAATKEDITATFGHADKLTLSITEAGDLAVGVSGPGGEAVKTVKLP